MARWVTIKQEAFPFDYRVPGSAAWLHFKSDGPGDTGERYVPDDQADFIVKRGYGVEGKLDGSTAKSRKGKTPRRRTAKRAVNAQAADTGPDASVADAPVASAHRSRGRRRVDTVAG